MALLQIKDYQVSVQTNLVANIANMYYSLLMLDKQLEIVNDMEGLTKDTWQTMQLLKDAKVWGPRAIAVKKSLQRLNTAALEAALQHAGRIDKLVKGIGQGNVWEEFLRLGLRLCRPAATRPA